jgi:DEAD/DEAH box helicase domain-containing protein
VANGTAHDLFFYADPMRMISGSVEAAGCYLDAAAILQRQLTAFCLDNWVATGITKREFPTQLSDVLNAIERQDEARFPYNWLTFIQERQSELLEVFLSLFEGNVEDRTREQLQLFMEQGEQDEGVYVGEFSTDSKESGKSAPVSVAKSRPSAKSSKNLRQNRKPCRIAND